MSRATLCASLSPPSSPGGGDGAGTVKVLGPKELEFLSREKLKFCQTKGVSLSPRAPSLMENEDDPATGQHASSSSLDFTYLILYIYTTLQLCGAGSALCIRSRLWACLCRSVAFVCECARLFTLTLTQSANPGHRGPHGGGGF